MMGRIPVVSVLFVILAVVCTGTEAISCYYCKGMTNYDPNDCLVPTIEGSRAFMQECRKGDSCERKIARIDHKQDVVERGCSSNCDGRTYFWTEDFSVYCCNDENLCNSASSLYQHWRTLVLVVAGFAVWAGLRR